ncbi:uncharacterized protein KY384_008973 [Bacidia gigantensis]|uniref:uncharacterized protein n=1 Tax=Bacidia gigantensis TaxID=2732470 RepID=UPI001D04BB94|nr:uncharacterized protein KY384_008973 [Bacidia gigantensis]KAG8525329.1 hypothetical protein KY384_008973 [Bacidia gigantensis]
MPQLVSVSRILTILTVGFTKGSVILFLRQVFAGTAKKGYNLCTAPMVATGVWTLASTMTLARWKVVAAVDVCLEIMLVVIPAILFYSVKISKVRKATIIVAFLPRILVPAIFITYLEAYIRFRKYGGSSIEAVGTLVWQQVLCGYSLVSATTPCLKGFLGRFHTEGIAGTLESSYGNRAYGQNSTTRTNPDVYALESLDRKNSTKRPPKTEPVSLACYPGEAIHSATAYGGPLGDHSASSVKSFGSERMMIHRKIEYDVTST